jgi:beta-lactam-binding protein with PASTA domain
LKLGDAIQARRTRAIGRAARRLAEESAPEHRPAGLRFAGWLFGLTVGGLAVGYVVATRIIFPAPPPPRDLVQVPSLQGLALDRARERVLDAGLDLGAAEGLRHPALDSGVVIGQAPLPGQLSRRGEPVRLMVSLGPLRQAVPDVANLRGDRALRVLEASGFEVGVDSVEAEEALGTVVTVDPPVGTVLQVPGSVRLTLSKGPPLIPMPYLLGLPHERAVDTLRILGIGVAQVDSVFRFGRDQGIVVEQDPPADSLVRRGAGVRLSVGREGGG